MGLLFSSMDFVSDWETDYERKRHLKHYLSPNGTLPISQETRGFNESTGETFTLRTKEDAEDYRYMPDSNLPGLEIDEVSWWWLGFDVLDEWVIGRLILSDMLC